MSHISKLTVLSLGMITSALTPVSIVGQLALTCGVAAAQDAESTTKLELLPTGTIVGDGSTPFNLQFLALDPNGAPVTGLTARVSVSGGNAGRLTENGDGFYQITWTPPNVGQVSTQDLSLKYKVPGSSNQEQSWRLKVTPAFGEEISVTATPARVILGQDENASLSIQLTNQEMSTVQASDLVIRSSAGEVSNLTKLGNGEFTALYMPPTKPYPRVAIITVADRRDPTRTYGSLSIPLVGKIDFPVTGQPNSKVLIKIDDRTYGPIQSNNEGRAKIPVEVPPGNPVARVVSILDDNTTDEPLDLMIPKSQRIQLFPLHQSVPADPEAQIEVRAMVIKPDGTPNNNAQVQFQASTGKLSKSTRLGDGVYVATFTPPQGNRTATATISATITGADDENQTDSQVVNLVSVRPGQLSISSDPAILAKNARDFSVRAQVTGPDGVGISGRQLDFRVRGAKINGATQDLGGGDYQTTFTTTSDGPVEIVATVASPASGNPLRQILVFPSNEVLTNNGKDTTMITILTVDEFGYPVTNVPVGLSVEDGDGTMTAVVETDGSGMAQTRYTAGKELGVSHILASSNGVTGAAGILQLSNPATMTTELPFSGTAEAQELHRSWEPLVLPHRIEREGMIGAAVVATQATTEVGPISRLSLTAEPAVVAPGGTVTLRTQAVDSVGRGASNRALQFFSDPGGEQGTVTDLGNGNYEVKLTVPTTATGNIKIGVMSPKTSVSAFITIPVVGPVTQADTTTDTDSAESTSTENTTTETTITETTTNDNAVAEVTDPPKEKKEKKEKKPKTPRSSTLPGIQLGMAYEGGLYSYRQSPATSNGPMYHKIITVGGGITNPAGAAGIRLDGSAAIPGLDWLHADAQFRATRWSMEIGEGFEEPVGDSLHDFALSARAGKSFDVGFAHLRPGVSVGFVLNDFIVYKLTQVDGQPYIEHDQLMIFGARTGLNLGIDMDELQVHTRATIDNNTARTGYGWHLQGAYRVYENWSVTAHGGLLNRSTDVYSTTDDGGTKRVGSLLDGYTYFGVGLGWSP